MFPSYYGSWWGVIHWFWLMLSWSSICVGGHYEVHLTSWGAEFRPICDFSTLVLLWLYLLDTLVTLSRGVMRLRSLDLNMEFYFICSLCFTHENVFFFFTRLHKCFVFVIFFHQFSLNKKHFKFLCLPFRSTFFGVFFSVSFTKKKMFDLRKSVVF